MIVCAVLLHGVGYADPSDPTSEPPASGSLNTTDFATAIDTVRWVAMELLRHGRVRRGHLGIVAQTVSVPQRLRRHAEIQARTAVRIVRAEKEGPAARGGLEDGDLLLQFGGESVVGIDDLHRLLSAEQIGQHVTVEVWRLGRRRQVTVVPVEPPGD